jgi:hypothetical protein
MKRTRLVAGFSVSGGEGTAGLAAWLRRWRRKKGSWGRAGCGWGRREPVPRSRRCKLGRSDCEQRLQTRGMDGDEGSMPQYHAERDAVQAAGDEGEPVLLSALQVPQTGAGAEGGRADAGEYSAAGGSGYAADCGGGGDAGAVGGADHGGRDESLYGRVSGGFGEPGTDGKRASGPGGGGACDAGAGGGVREAGGRRGTGSGDGVSRAAWAAEEGVVVRQDPLQRAPEEAGQTGDRI